MELDDYQTLRLIQERIVAKIHSLDNWPDFIEWTKSITRDKFKVFVLSCLNEIVDKGDVTKADLLEVKSQIEGTS